MKKCILLANGDSPKKSIVSYLMKKGYNTFICADGGANSAKKLNLIPDVIIGDLDSISDKTLKYYSNKCNVIKLRRQNYTDVEKCLKYAIKQGFTNAIMVGATGSRLDHSFCNMGIVLKYSNKIKIKILHRDSLLEVVYGKLTFSTSRHETISIYGIDQQTTITSKGLKYKLCNTALPFGVSESTSNYAIGNRVTLDVKGGKVFLIRDVNILKKNDLI